MTTEPTARASGSYRRDIQGLRGLAVLLVVAYHAGLPLPGGFLGVDVFFVISGFVIAGLLLRELERDGRIDLPRFYARRVRRLLPALAVVVAFTLVTSLLWPSPPGQPQETIKTGIGAMGLVANVVLQRSVPGYFHLSAKNNPLLHTWSLSVEEQFYLVIPGLMLVAWMAGRRRAASRLFTAVALVAVGVVSAGVVVLAHAAPAVLRLPATALFFSSLTRAWEFVAGALLAFARLRLQPAAVAGRASMVLGLAAIAVAVVLVPDQAMFPNGWVLLPIAGTVLTILGGGAPGWNPLASAPFVRLGDWSYSWYLWHWPCLVFASQVAGEQAHLVLPLTAAGSIAPAVLSYAVIEQPIRHSPRIGTRESYALLGALVIATMVLAVAAERTVHFGWGQPWSMGAHVALQRDCDAQPVDFDACTWPVEDARGVVLLVGDSQAWALADGVIAAGRALGLSTTVATRNGCPFVAPGIASAIAGRACGASIERTLDYARRHHPAVLVIANAETYDPAVLSGYRDLVGFLPRDRTPRVVVVRQPPGGDRLSGGRSILVNRSAPDRTRALARPDPALTETLRGLTPRVVVVDPRAVLCVGERCDVAVGGGELYTDANHLTVAGALRLVPAITEALAVHTSR